MIDDDAVDEDGDTVDVSCIIVGAVLSGTMDAVVPEEDDDEDDSEMGTVGSFRCSFSLEYDAGSFAFTVGIVNDRGNEDGSIEGIVVVSEVIIVGVVIDGEGVTIGMYTKPKPGICTGINDEEEEEEDKLAEGNEAIGTFIMFVVVCCGKLFVLSSFFLRCCCCCWSLVHSSTFATISTQFVTSWITFVDDDGDTGVVTVVLFVTPVVVSVIECNNAACTSAVVILILV